jgi:GAF domain-containing protein
MDVEPVEELDLATAADVGAAVNTARWYSQAARDLQEADGWHDTLQRIVELAAKIVGADLAVLIGLPHLDGPPALLAATDFAAAEELVALQRAAGAAPAWQAILDRCTVQVDDITADERWSGYGQELVAALSFRTVLAFSLLIDGESLASLALYTRRAGGFNADEVELTAAFAEHAAIAFNQAAQADQIRNLRVALDHARIIGAALGIMMVGLNITQDQAFDRLRIVSQHRNRKLFELAQEIVQTGSIPVLTDFAV